jgi:thiol-disulfide isomerase/thioredoxin
MNSKCIKLGFLFIIIGIIFLSCQKAEISTSTSVVATNADPNAGCTDVLAKNFKYSANEDDCSCQYDFASKVSAKALTSFTQKVLLEEFTGTWCGWCPIGRETSAKLVKNPAIIAVEVHFQDEMENRGDIYLPLKTQFSTPAFPTGLVNRRKSVVGTTTIMGESEWKPTADFILQNDKTPNGIAIDTKLEGKNLQVLTHLKFQNAITENYGLGIYLVEYDVMGYSQTNYLSNDAQFSMYEAYKLPAQITNMVYQNVTRIPIAPIIGGVDIPASALKDGKEFQKLFKVEMPESIKNATNCRIIAFILNRSNKQIVNVQEVKIGESKDWE